MLTGPQEAATFEISLKPKKHSQEIKLWQEAGKAPTTGLVSQIKDFLIGNYCPLHHILK